MYQYYAEVLRIIDGDTLTLRIDLGYYVQIRSTVRLAFIDAPEMATPQGPVSRAAVEQWLDIHEPHDANRGAVVVQTFKDKADKYGRMIAEIRCALCAGNDQTLNQWMMAEGHAVAYPTK